ncbi:hypothetical protein MAJ_08566, partial [Metarhizium majus ARSEF 297]
MAQPPMGRMPRRERNLRILLGQDAGRRSLAARLYPVRVLALSAPAGKTAACAGFLFVAFDLETVAADAGQTSPAAFLALDLAAASGAGTWMCGFWLDPAPVRLLRHERRTRWEGAEQVLRFGGGRGRRWRRRDGGAWLLRE